MSEDGSTAWQRIADRVNAHPLIRAKTSQPLNGADMVLWFEAMKAEFSSIGARHATAGNHQESVRQTTATSTQGRIDTARAGITD